MPGNAISLGASLAHQSHVDAPSLSSCRGPAPGDCGRGIATGISICSLVVCSVLIIVMRYCNVYSFRIGAVLSLQEN